MNTEPLKQKLAEIWNCPPEHFTITGPVIGFSVLELSADDFLHRHEKNIKQLKAIHDWVQNIFELSQIDKNAYGSFDLNFAQLIHDYRTLGKTGQRGMLYTVVYQNYSIPSLLHVHVALPPILKL